MADYIAITRRSAGKGSSSQTTISYCQNPKERGRRLMEKSSQLGKPVRRGLDLESVVKQLNRLLQSKRLEKVEVERPPYTKEELARLLGVSVNKINRILHCETAAQSTIKSTISKITMPLIELYLSVKFNEQS
jgi:hypothetical protein